MNDLLKSKKVICVFAHPDDEAFGPGGTIAKLSQTTKVQLICVTDGNSPRTEIKNLDKIRKGELESSCKILVVEKIHYLNYKDGSLCNSCYHDLANKIQEILEKEKPDTLITFEPRGVSGHIDHVTVSMVTAFVFEKLRFIKNLYYYCISDKARSLIPGYFIYFPPGYKKENIDVAVNVADVWKTKVEAMKCHKSQIQDVKRILASSLFLPKEEYFLKFRR